MFADVFLNPETDGWLRYISEAGNIEIIVENRFNATEFETDARRKIKQCHDVVPNQNADTKAE